MKGFLSQHNIEFTERNVREDRKAMLELVDSGFRGTPVTLIGGEPVVGYVPDKFEELLGI